MAVGDRVAPVTRGVFPTESEGRLGVVVSPPPAHTPAFGPRLLFTLEPGQHGHRRFNGRFTPDGCTRHAHEWWYEKALGRGRTVLKGPSSADAAALRCLATPSPGQTDRTTVRSHTPEAHMGPDETRKYAQSFLRKHRAHLLSLRSGGFRSRQALVRAEQRARALSDDAARISALVEVALRAARIAPDEAERIVHTLPNANREATELAYAHLAAAFAVPYPDRSERVAASITDEVWAAQARRRIATALAAADLPRAERLLLSTADRAAQSVAQRAHALLWVAEQGAAQSLETAQRLIALARKLAAATRSEFLVALADVIHDEVTHRAL